MKKIVENFTIVKPKAERVHFRSRASEEGKKGAAANKYGKTRQDAASGKTGLVLIRFSDCRAPQGRRRSSQQPSSRPLSGARR